MPRDLSVETTEELADTGGNLPDRRSRRPHSGLSVTHSPTWATATIRAADHGAFPVSEGRDHKMTTDPAISVSASASDFATSPCQLPSMPRPTGTPP